MSLLIGKDRQDFTHYLQSGAPSKACGYQLALCAIETSPTELPVDTTRVDCLNCRHAYAEGLHLQAPHVGLGTSRPRETE
jgi:hypothetical protein